MPQADVQHSSWVGSPVRTNLVTGLSLFKFDIGAPGAIRTPDPLVRRIRNFVTYVNQFGSDALLEMYDIQSYAISVRLAYLTVEIFPQHHPVNVVLWFGNLLPSSICGSMWKVIANTQKRK